MWVTFVVLREMSQTFGWIAFQFGSVIRVSLRMICDHFCDPLTFPVSPSSGRNFYMSNTVVYDQKPAILITFPSVSAVGYFVLC